MFVGGDYLGRSQVFLGFTDRLPPPVLVSCRSPKPQTLKLAFCLQAKGGRPMTRTLSMPKGPSTRCHVRLEPQTCTTIHSSERLLLDNNPVP